MFEKQYRLKVFKVEKHVSRGIIEPQIKEELIHTSFHEINKAAIDTGEELCIQKQLNNNRDKALIEELNLNNHAHARTQPEQYSVQRHTLFFHYIVDEINVLKSLPVPID